jgi:hypothetical protein
MTQHPHPKHTPGDFDHSGVDDVGYLTGLLEEAKRKLRIDPKRIYIIGHSNGGVRGRLSVERGEGRPVLASLNSPQAQMTPQSLQPLPLSPQYTYQPTNLSTIRNQAMTNILACDHSELVTAVATVAPGEIPDPCTPSHPISMLEVCTSEDNIVKLVRVCVCLCVCVCVCVCVYVYVCVCRVSRSE